MRPNSGMKPGKVTFEGRLVRLRPFNTETDAEVMWRFINDPKVNQYLLRYQPLTLKQEREWLDAVGKTDTDIAFAMETLEGELIGSIGLHQISWKDRVATSGTLIGNPEYWGKGYGTDAKLLLLSYAFYTLNLHKVCSNVITYNKRSERYSLRCGYKREGLQKQQIYRNGKYWDKVLLAVFRKDWESIWRLCKRTGRVR